MDWQVIVGWSLAILCFLAGIVGTIIPILPGSLLVLLGSFFYSWLISPLPWYFYVIQGVLIVIGFLADYLMGIWGVKRYGGSKYSAWGSIIGLILGIIIFNLPGIILGPFIGATVGDLLAGRDFKAALKGGWGAVVGSLGSIPVKLGLILLMLIVFFLFVWF